MTTKQLIQTEVDSIGKENLEELYLLVKRFAQSKRRARPERARTLMSKLKRIRIEAPEDFAANHDLYIAGDKRAKANLR